MDTFFVPELLERLTKLSIFITSHDIRTKSRPQILTNMLCYIYICTYRCSHACIHAVCKVCDRACNYPLKQRLSSFWHLKINLHVLEKHCYQMNSGILWINIIGSKNSMIHEIEQRFSQTLVFSSKGHIYFSHQKTDFCSSGDILVWF